MLVRCLAMMRGGGETRHLAWTRELTSLGVTVEMIAGRPLLFGGPRYPIDDLHVTLLRSPYARDFVYRNQHRRGFGRLTVTALHADEEWFCRAAWRRIATSPHKPDLVHAHALHQAARLRVGGIPVVINLPGEPNARYARDLQRADALVADGWAAQHLPATLGRTVERVQKGVDADEFRPDGPSLRQALRLESELLGREHPDAINCMNTLALILLSRTNLVGADQLFAALTEGGLVTMPLEKTFWTSKFGMVQDRFGVSWMVSVERK